VVVLGEVRNRDSNGGSGHVLHCMVLQPRRRPPPRYDDKRGTSASPGRHVREAHGEGDIIPLTNRK
jgi:hypothetical protein